MKKANTRRPQAYELRSMSNNTELCHLQGLKPESLTPKTCEPLLFVIQVSGSLLPVLAWSGGCLGPMKDELSPFNNCGIMANTLYLCLSVMDRSYYRGTISELKKLFLQFISHKWPWIRCRRVPALGNPLYLCVYKMCFSFCHFYPALHCCIVSPKKLLLEWEGKDR